MTRTRWEVSFYQGTLQLRQFDRGMIDRLIQQSIPLRWDDRQRCWVCDAMQASRIRTLLTQWRCRLITAASTADPAAADPAAAAAAAVPSPSQSIPAGQADAVGHGGIAGHGGFSGQDGSADQDGAIKRAESAGPAVVWDVELRQPSLQLPPARLPPLRPDQQRAVDQFLSAGSQGMIVMPTGTGKTMVALTLLSRWQVSSLIVVPVRDLMYQWHEQVRRYLSIDAGLIGDGVHRVSPISITTYDSAAIHMPRIGNRFRMIIFDEVHHLAGEWRSDAARMSAASIRLGLTATLPPDPQRTDRLQQLLGPLVYRQSIEEASGKTLAAYTVRRIAVPMSSAEDAAYRRYGKLIQEFVRARREEDAGFQWEQTYQLVADQRLDPAIAAAASAALQAFRAKRKIEEQAEGKFRVLEDLFRLHAGQPVLVFTGSNVMARQISSRFMVPCLLSHCAKRERQDLLQGFAEGRYPVLVANRVLDEGVDLPEVKTAIVLGGLASTRQATQRLGRVLRKSPSGQAAVLYEIVTDDSNEVQRSRARRRTAAYQPAASRHSSPHGGPTHGSASSTATSPAATTAPANAPAPASGDPLSNADDPFSSGGGRS